MKKFYSILFLFLLIAVGVSADPVSKETALKSAQSFMSKRHLHATGNLSLAYKSVRSHASKGRGVAAKDAYYYVFNHEEGGFVIVSGDDATEEILGYSDTGTFDTNNIPENMKELLDGYQEEITYARSHGLKRAKATEVTEVAKQVIEPLISTQWGQDAPFNQQCFTTGGSQAVTGCVATAMAQVMNYYKWPQSATTAIPAYSTYEELPATTFDWDNMLSAYTGNETTEDVNAIAVAKLMHYCGQSVEMSYGTYGSGASTENAIDALKNYFGYNNNVSYIGRGCFTTEEWDGIVYNELYNERPIIYSASSGEGGHAFICDGYDGYGLFHINWGWEGRWNGYYRLQALFPQYSGSFSRMLNTGGYSRDQTAVIGISPKENINSPYTEVCQNLRARVSGFSLNTNEIDYSNRPDFSSIRYKFSYSAPSLDPVSLGFGLYKDGKRISQTTLYNSTIIPGCYTYTTTFSFYGLGRGLEDGTYQIKSISKMANSDTWLESVDADRIYIEVVIANSKATFTIHNNADGISVTNIEKVKHSSTNFLRVYFQNNSDIDYQGNVYLFCNDKRKVTERLYLDAGQEDFVDFEIEVGYNETDIMSIRTYNDVEYPILYETQMGTIPSEPIASTTNIVTLVSSNIRCVDTNSKKMFGKIFEGTLILRNDADVDFSGNATLTFNYLISETKEGNKTSITYSHRTSSVPVTIKPNETKEVIIKDIGSVIGDQIWYTISVGGNSISGGGSFNRFTVVDGFNYWDNKGVCYANELTSSINVPDNATAISFEGLDISGATITPNSNPNTIYYLDANATVPSSLNGKNVVKGYQAVGNFNLQDGYGFFVPKMFTVSGTASYARTTTMAGTEKAGWNTIVLPFEVSQVKNADANQQVNWRHLSDTANKDFWLKEFKGVNDTKVVFEDVENWMPNEPYIISVPTELVDKKMVFSSSNTQVYPTETCQKVTNDYSFIGTTYTQALSDVYVMNERGTAFEPSQNATVNAGHAFFDLASTLSPCPTNIPLSTRLIGDANGDGVVNISDAVLTVSYILGDREVPIVFENADVNEDNEINVTDAVGIVNIILGQ